MTRALAPVAAPRVTLATVSSGVRIVLDGQATGPVMTRRAARVVCRWLEGGALAEMEGGGSKLERALTSVDGAFRDVSDLLKNGLR